MNFLKTSARSGACGLVVAFLLSSPLIFASSANALEYQLGDLALQLDTTVSVSAAMRTGGQSCSHISIYNGGCLDSRGAGWDVNLDDGDINVKKGEIFSAPVKVISELSGKWRDYGFYVSGKAWYDMAVNGLADSPSAYGPVEWTHTYRHSARPFKDGLRGDSAYDAALKDAKIRDAYVYASWNVAGMPVNVRLGKQVVSWGESTFIQGGISSYLPLDVAALYQPGLQLKEVFLPQGTAYASVGLPDNLSVELMYVYGHEKSELPACGTLFSVSDALGRGCAYGVSTGEFDPSLVTFPTSPPALLRRISDQDPHGQGQYGAALRYYADWMGQGTDLGLYFVNFQSKLPIGTFTALDDKSGFMALLQSFCGNIDSTTCMTTGANFASDTDGVYADWGIATSKAFLGVAIFNGEKYLLAQYPADIKMLGASFNTSVTFLPEIFGDGTALSGEIAYYPEMPFQVDTNEINANDLALYGFTTSAGTAPIYTGDIAAAGQVIKGYRRTEALNGSFSTLSTLTASNWFVKNTGGDFGVLLINAGFQYLPNSSGNRFAIPGSSATHINPGVAVALGDICLTQGGAPNQHCVLEAKYASAFSAGYRVYAYEDYHTAFGTGWTLTPNLYWAHDVTGYSAGPIGPGFIEGKKTLKLGVDATFQSVKVGLGYTMNFGAELRNNDYDKDFVSLTASYAF